MLFSSLPFLYGFLPLVLAAFAIARRVSTVAGLLVLLVASVVFYGWSQPEYVPLLLGSIAVNYGIGRWLTRHRSRLVLGLAIAANLALLGVFKYAGFTVGNLNGTGLVAWAVPAIALPLAISFFTFQQIAYLVDSWRGITIPCGPLRYAVFVSFFPQLIAGPIVREQEVMGALNAGRIRITLQSLTTGLSVFAIGLAKKVVFADNLAPIANASFDAVRDGTAISAAQGWVGALAYGAQIYFDFSAYSDMAIGLGLMVGLTLPLNFLSPYKAGSVIDFWRRWHVTLSRFLRDYLYFPLGGNRRGPVRRHANIMVVMLLGGLWHGAGWNFVLWGGLHGAFLVVNHLYRAMDPGETARAAARWVGPPLTLLAVTLAWVPFRAEGASFIDYYRIMFHAGAGGGAVAGSTLAWLAAAWGLCLLAPNTAQLFGLAGGEGARWRPSLPWAAATAAALGVASAFMISTPPNAFIYFQF